MYFFISETSQTLSAYLQRNIESKGDRNVIYEDTSDFSEGEKGGQDIQASDPELDPVFLTELIEPWGEHETYEDKHQRITEKQKDCYFYLIKEFCPCVSPVWKGYLRKIRMRDTATFKNNLTPSDEAYTIWFIKHNFESEKINATRISEVGYKKFKEEEKEKKISKPHKAKVHLGSYNVILKNVIKNRKHELFNKFLQDVFFDKYLNFLKSRQLPAVQGTGSGGKDSDDDEPPVPKEYDTI